VIPVFGSCVGKEELEEISSSLENQWMGLGPKVKRFEQNLAERLGLPELLMVDSGSNALYLALRILDLPPGSEVIMPALTWIACAQVVLINRCRPVFCDVDLETHNVTAETIEPHITSKTAAIMPVHFAGKPARIGPILDLGLPIIEDAAHAVDSKIGSQYCGSIGTVGVYSFDAVKNLATPEGGGLTASDPDLRKKARLLRYCGIDKSGFEASATRDRWWEYHVAGVCVKLLPNDINASVGLAQLRKLDTHQAYRKRIWEHYQQEFTDLEWLVRPSDPEADEQHSYFTYNVRFTDGKRDRHAKALLDQGIFTTMRYQPLHLYPIYESNAKLPICEKLNEESLCLPLHPRLSDRDVEQIVTAVKGLHG
jgi:aminotransferase